MELHPRRPPRAVPLLVCESSASLQTLLARTSGEEVAAREWLTDVRELTFKICHPDSNNAALVYAKCRGPATRLLLLSCLLCTCR